MCQCYEDALSDFSAVIVHDPGNAHAYFRRAFCLKSLRRFDESAYDFEKAKELDPGNPDLVVNYRNIHDTEVVLLCDAGCEKRYC